MPPRASVSTGQLKAKVVVCWHFVGEACVSNETLFCLYRQNGNNYYFYRQNGHLVSLYICRLHQHKGVQPIAKDKKPVEHTKKLHNERGKFAVGNPGGTSDRSKRANHYRALLDAAVTEDEFTEVVKSIVSKAKNGVYQCQKLVLEYTLGKPMQHIAIEAPEEHAKAVRQALAEMNAGMKE